MSNGGISTRSGLPPESPRFFLRTLGGLSLTASGGGEPILATQRKRLALVAALAADANGGITRERLLALFWSESDAERARNALNQMAFAIRRELGDDAIASDGTSLRINTAVVESDVGRFRVAIRSGRFADAIAEYHGPFLDGVFLRDTPEFERWASDVRASLAADYWHALEREIDDATNASPPRSADAVRYARLLAAHDPLSTQVALKLMRELERSGDSAAALKHAAIHAAQVRAELQIEPGALFEREVTRLRAVASASTPSAASSHASAFEKVSADAGVSTIASATSPTAMTETISEIDTQPPAEIQRVARKHSISTVRRFGLAVSLASVATVAFLVATAARPRSDVVVIAVETDGRDAALAAVRDNILRAASRLLQGRQRFTVIVADSTGRDARAGCFVRFFTPRCRAAYAASSRLMILGDTVSALATVLTRDSNTARRDLVPVTRPRAELAALSADVAEAVAGALTALSDQTMPELASGATLPRQDAYIEYAHAIEQWLNSDWEKATATLEAAAKLDTMFAAPRIATLAIGSAASRAPAADWIERHRTMLSAHDLAYVAAIAAHNEGNSEEWFTRASQFRRLAPNDPFALNEFAEAAFANNYYRAADSASTALQGLRGWPSQMISMLYAQVDARHNAGDFAGALETLQTIAARLPSAPFPCEMSVVQLAATGREAAVDSQISRCVILRDNVGDLGRLGRRVSFEDELYRRAGREYAWHGHAESGRRALAKAYSLERQLYATDTTANNGWLAKELSRDWAAAHDLMMADFGWMYASGPCAPRDRRRACIPRNRLRFGVTAAHVGDTATALATLRWLDAPPHEDSLYKVERAKVLLALGRRDEAMRSLRASLDGVAPGTWMHANTELLELRGDPAFEALIAPRSR